MQISAELCAAGFTLKMAEQKKYHPVRRNNQQKARQERKENVEKEKIEQELQRAEMQQKMEYLQKKKDVENDFNRMAISEYFPRLDCKIYNVIEYSIYYNPPEQISDEDLFEIINNKMREYANDNHLIMRSLKKAVDGTSYIAIFIQEKYPWVKLLTKQLENVSESISSFHSSFCAKDFEVNVSSS